MKFLVDMNLSPGWVDFLTKEDFEAVHWSAVGQSNAPDIELMHWASAQGFVVLTADLDFGAVLAAGQKSGPSVVQLRSDNLSPNAVGQIVLSAIRKAEGELIAGALLSIDVARYRLRILPLKE
jgi:predicted nuclease of predicted toxin-antitoxin system